MLPKATLISGQGNSTLVRFGSKLFEFNHGKKVEVPVAVALILQDMVGRKKQPLFKITGMPEIVETVVSETNTEKSAEPRQLQF